ncbi:ASCH domain-containing protein [Yersinia enterocolitica]
MQNTGSVNSKERPILFNSEMVNAILSGRKTQTRRIMGNQPAGQDLEAVHVRHNDDFNFQWYGNLGESSYFPCPLGKPGDQLWVRECFSDLEDFDFFNPSVPDVIPGYWYWADGNPEWGNWTKPKPSIHMPRRASRINLLITGVRVERLQSITLGDICKEVGCGLYDFFPATDGFRVWTELWDSIYGQKEGENWQANPWVWVINFERMEAK